MNGPGQQGPPGNGPPGAPPGDQGPPAELPPAVDGETVRRMVEEQIQQHNEEWLNPEENFEGAGEQVVHDDEHLE